MITIDGSYGEGGGQILRTALSLSAMLTVPMRLVNIRAGRGQPGLRPQHVQSVKAAAAICAATVDGAQVHSQELLFQPQSPPQPGRYRFDIGTAGSASLVLQTVLIPLSLAAEPSRVLVRGGTHVSWSPPFHYLAEVYLHALEPLGYRASANLRRWGFYPQGGGEVELHISPRAAVSMLRPAWTGERGGLATVEVLSAAANVGNQVTARQAKQAVNRLIAEGFQPSSDLVNPSALGPGTCVFLLAQYDKRPATGDRSLAVAGCRAGFTGYGRRGYPAERVADDAVDAFLAHHAHNAAVDPHLADQLVLPLAMLEHPLTYATSKITQHLLTNAWVVEQFLGQRFRILGQEGEPGEVQCLSSHS